MFEEKHSSTHQGGKESCGWYCKTRSFTTLTNPDHPRARTRVFKDPGGHATGVFGSDPLDPMLPIMICDNKFRTADGVQIKPSWVKHLPEVVTFWRFENKGWIHKVLIKKRAAWMRKLSSRLLCSKSSYIQILQKFQVGWWLSHLRSNFYQDQ